MRRLRLAAHAGIALTVGLGAGVAIASAEWYLGNADSGTYVSVPNGWYTGNGTKSNWIKGRLDNKTTGYPKFHIRYRYNAGCSGSYDTISWYSGNYGNPRLWQIGYSTGACGNSEGQNVSGGPANLAAGQFH